MSYGCCCTSGCVRPDYACCDGCQFETFEFEFCGDTVRVVDNRDDDDGRYRGWLVFRWGRLDMVLHYWEADCIEDVEKVWLDWLEYDSIEWYDC